MMQYLKYILEGLAIAAAAYFIPRKSASLQEVAMIALTGAATFAVLDLFAPAVASGARLGAGFGVGANHVGFGEGFENKNNRSKKVSEEFEAHGEEDHDDEEEEEEEEDFQVEGFSKF